MRRAVEADERVVHVDRVPDVLARRLVSVRIYDERAAMVGADVCDGRALHDLLSDRIADPAIAWIDVPTARQGCFLARTARER